MNTTKDDKQVYIIIGPLGIDFENFIRRNKINPGVLLEMSSLLEKNDLVKLITEPATSLEVRRAKQIMWGQYCSLIQSGQKLVCCADNFDEQELEKYEGVAVKSGYKIHFFKVSYCSPNLAFWSAKRQGYDISAEVYYRYFAAFYGNDISLDSIE
jgi:hypothetical protein